MFDKAKAGIVGVCLLVLFGCHNKGSITRSFENGAEIVSNPVRVRTVALPTIFRYMAISQQRRDLVQRGLRTMGEFDVGDTGDIYIVGYKNEKNYVTKLDGSGQYLLSFGSRGQGPGELEMPVCPSAIGDRLYITDRMKKLVIYGAQGTFIEEKRLPSGIDSAEPLSNGNFLLFGRDESATPGRDYTYYKLAIADQNFQEVQRLDSYRWYYEDKKLMPFFMWKITKDQIIVINEERNYEVHVFDVNGRLMRKIRKAYLPQYVDSVIQKAILGRHQMGSSIKSNYIPSPLPCMRFFIADEKGRLLIMTYQRGRGPKSFVYDLFDINGELAGKMDFDFNWSGEYFGLKKYLIKNGLFYYYEQNEEGYLTLIINKIKWPDRH